MRLFLIRHGETVDNVAGVYAGVRDSELTNHGVQQAARLGDFFRKNDTRFTNIFSSQLQRAYKTAEHVRKAQSMQGDCEQQSIVEVVKVPLLIERDFGFYEGKKFFERPRDSNKSGKEAYYNQHKNEPGFVDVESKETIAKRADAFLDEHLIPLLSYEGVDNKQAVAIVSHGVILTVLWRRLLKRLPPDSVRFAPAIAWATSAVSLEHLGGWSNTGYLELELANKFASIALEASNDPASRMTAKVSIEDETKSYGSASAHHVLAATPDSDVPEVIRQAVTGLASIPSTKSVNLNGWIMIIHKINSQDHLQGLKRTGGGVSGAKHDENQKSIESFFKRKKVD